VAFLAPFRRSHWFVSMRVGQLSTSGQLRYGKIPERDCKTFVKASDLCGRPFATRRQTHTKEHPCASLSWKTTYLRWS